MKKILLNILLIALCSYFVACKKYTTDSTTTGNSNYFLNGDTAPRIMFFDVMDFGSMDVKLNGIKVTSIAQYYNSTYFYAKEGTNTISLNFTGKTDALNTTLELVRNTRYSCFFYKVGNEWKYNLVKDDIGATLNNNRAAIRVLDFRTEAYYNYINVRIASPGGDYIDQKNRNFLDHVTFGGYTYFNTSSTNIGSGTYTIKMYNDTITLPKYRTVNFDSQGYYSVILNTPSNITPYTSAIYHIWPDVVKHIK